MLNAICRYLISRCLDDGRTPPRWARRRIERTPSLREYRESIAGVDRRLRAAAAVPDAPSFLAARACARARSAVSRPEPALPWTRLAPVLGACVLLAGVFVAARFVTRPAPSAPQHRFLGELFARVPTPEDVVRRLESQGRDEARQLWADTRAAVELVVARMPAPPPLKRGTPGAP